MVSTVVSLQIAQNNFSEEQSAPLQAAQAFSLVWGFLARRCCRSPPSWRGEVTPSWWHHIATPFFPAVLLLALSLFVTSVPHVLSTSAFYDRQLNQELFEFSIIRIQCISAGHTLHTFMKELLTDFCDLHESIALAGPEDLICLCWKPAELKPDVMPSHHHKPQNVLNVYSFMSWTIIQIITAAVFLLWHKNYIHETRNFTS